MSHRICALDSNGRFSFFDISHSAFFSFLVFIFFLSTAQAESQTQYRSTFQGTDFSGQILAGQVATADSHRGVVRFNDTTTSPYAAFSAKKVEVLVTEWCGYCRALEADLKSNHIGYTRYDVEKSPKGIKLYRELGGGGIPITIINSKTVIRGNNIQGIKDALKP